MQVTPLLQNLIGCNQDVGRAGVLSEAWLCKESFQAPVVVGRTQFFVDYWMKASILYHVALPVRQLAHQSQQGNYHSLSGRWKLQSYIITKVTSHHLCQVLLEESQVLLSLKRRGLHKGIDKHQAGITASHSSLCTTQRWHGSPLFPFVLWWPTWTVWRALQNSLLSKILNLLPGLSYWCSRQQNVVGQ